LSQRQADKVALAEEISVVEKRIKELTRTVDEIRERRHSMEVHLSRTEIELENIQNNIWEDYEISYANALRYRDSQLGLTRIKREIKEIEQRIDTLR